MTLVEIIISIALLGIIATLVLTVFASSMLVAINSGDNTSVAEVADGAITHKIIFKDGVTTNANVYFNGTQYSNDESAQIAGQYIEEPRTSDKNQTILKTFVTD